MQVHNVVDILAGAYLWCIYVLNIIQHIYAPSLKEQYFFSFLAFIGMTSTTVERTMQSAESGVKFMENTWNDEGEGEEGGRGSVLAV